MFWIMKNTSGTTSPFDSFLKRIHRRWMWVRAIERVGVGLLFACGIALILSIILISRAESALSLVGLCLIVGCAVGGMIGWLARPSLADTAIEIDRQFELADLLATALSIRREHTPRAADSSGGDSFQDRWSYTIVALAEARCATLAGSSLILHRFGLGSWGGIGLSAAIVLAVGFLSTNPLILEARTSGEPLSPSASHALPNAVRPGNILQSSRDPRDNADPMSPQRSQMQDQQNPSLSAATESGDRSSASSQDQSGSGKARSDEPAVSPERLDGSSDAAASSAGEFATGGGDPAAAAARANTSGDVSNSRPSNQPPAPWTSDGWRAAQQRATDQLDRGQVPDAYRDLVRDYFAR